MNKTKIIKQITVIVKEIADKNEPGHDYFHIERVYKMAKKLAKEATCDAFLVELLALLHDVNDHKLATSITVKEILEQVGVDNIYQEKVLSILPYLSFSKYKILPEDFPIEGKIVSDADRLDAIGAIGIARAFSYGGAHNRKMYNTEDSTIKHFDEKLLILDQYLYLDKAKKIASKRMKMLNSFYKEFLKEIK